MNHILILGAASDVAMKTAELFAQKGFKLTLAARDVKRLEPFASDLEIRLNATVELAEVDVEEVTDCKNKLQQIVPLTDVVISVVGYLGSQEDAERNLVEAEKIMNLNYNYLVLALSTVANIYQERNSGTIIGISSVAGERGRMSNYFYGSAKAGFTAFLSGLRNRLSHQKVHVMTVKPGFMYTKMTENLDLPAPLTIHPEKAARLIYKGYKSKKNTIYISSIWRLVMFIIKTIPEPIFKKLKL